MPGELVAEPLVNAVFVGVNLRALINYFADRGLDVLSSDVGDDATTNVPATFNHDEYGRLFGA